MAVLLCSAVLGLVLGAACPASAGFIQLTGDPSHNSLFPSVSADGWVVVFSSSGDPTGDNPDHLDEVFIMRTDGSGLRQLTSDPSHGSILPSVSADGSVVAFSSYADLTGGNPDHSSEVFLVNSDGTGLRQLTDDAHHDSYLDDISGDGSTVVFYSYADLSGGNGDHSWEAFVVKSDGTGLRQLTSDPSYGSGGACISADGSVVAFASRADFTGGNPDHSWEIFLIGSDGTGLRQLTSDLDWFSESPSISGDGSIVAFTSNADLTGGNSDHSWEIFTINWDGSGLRQLTNDPSGGASYAPCISADASLVAFMSEADLTGGNADRSDEICIVNADGSGLRQLTDDASYESWSPCVSADGSVVAFASKADLTGGNPDHSFEIFVALEDRWEVIAQDLPTVLAWGQRYDASVTAMNKGTTVWDGTYSLVSVIGVGGAAEPIDRWGMASVPIEGVTVPPAADYTFEFTVTGPPITTLLYGVPLTPASVAVDQPLDNNWMLANASALITTDTAEKATTVSRFADDQPGTAGAWARFWIEELAGRVPLVVSGYQQPDGSYLYQPTWQVDRAAMAVYMARALMLPMADYEGLFPDDVGPDHWAWPWIEAMRRAGLVQGFDPTHYGPSLIVNRDAMAVYVARGIVGGTEVPTGPPTPTFYQDVPTSHWAYDEIEYAHAHNVVQGVGGGWYLPGEPVTRDQMAVFIYKGFVMPTGAVVVLGGPAITEVDVDAGAAAGLYGWTASASGPQTDPGYAYVVLDAARLHTDLAPLDVVFRLVGPESPIPTHTVTLDADAIGAAIDAVTSSGGMPYLVVSWDIPGGLAAGDYMLVVAIGGNEVPRQPEFAIQ